MRPSPAHSLTCTRLYYVHSTAWSDPGDVWKNLPYKEDGHFQNSIVNEMKYGEKHAIYFYVDGDSDECNFQAKITLSCQGLTNDEYISRTMTLSTAQSILDSIPPENLNPITKGFYHNMARQTFFFSS